MNASREEQLNLALRQIHDFMGKNRTIPLRLDAVPPSFQPPTPVASKSFETAVAKLGSSLREITNEKAAPQTGGVFLKDGTDLNALDPPRQTSHGAQNWSPSKTPGDHKPNINNALPPCHPLTSGEQLALSLESHRAPEPCSEDTWSMSGMVDSSDQVPALEHDNGSANSKPGDQDILRQDSHDRAQETIETPTVAAAIDEWLDGISAGPNVLIFSLKRMEKMIPNVHQCDFNTESGELLNPVPYPHAPPQELVGEKNREMSWRQHNMSSTLHIQREIISRQKLNGTLKSKLQDKLLEQATVEKKQEENPWPKAECLIRPVEHKDFADIAAIINLEKDNDNCPQFFESVTASDIEHLYQHCQDTLRPFVVAVPTQDELLDSSKWPKGAEKAYKEYLSFREVQPLKQDGVMGFAFVTDTRMGILNKPCPASRFTGLVRVGVHPEHRRKLCGTALLDRILLCVMAHSSVVEYKWEGPESTQIYSKAYRQNQRQYTRLYIEAFTATKDDPELAWREKLLEKFEFQQMAYLPEAVKTDNDKYYESKWMGLSLWQLQAQATSEVADKPADQFLKA
jgi:GNAT superfamily N-acetyltransferase